MATYRGTDGIIRIGANAIGEVTAFSITGTATPIADNSMGDLWDTHLVGRRAFTGSISCNTDWGDVNGQRLLVIGASLSFEVFPTGTTQGRVKLSGTATVTSKEYSNNHDNTVASMTVQITGNGALTEATI